MPKLISDSRFRKLMEDQRKLRLLECLPPPNQNSRQIDALTARLELLERAVVQLARVLNPSVTDIDSALQYAEKFGRPKVQGSSGS